MTKDELQTLLDSHGADPAHWPAALRVAALGLIAADADACCVMSRAWWRWPAVLLDWEFAPAWPRVAALACCAAIGFMVGITGLDRPFERTTTVASTGADITSAAFEAEPMTGARP